MPDYRLTITTIPTVAENAQPIVTERFVRAKNQAQALAHVVKDSITVSVAETEDIIWLAQQGVKLETAE